MSKCIIRQRQAIKEIDPKGTVPVESLNRAIAFEQRHTLTVLMINRISMALLPVFWLREDSSWTERLSSRQS